MAEDSEAHQTYVQLGVLLAATPNLRAVDQSSNVPDETLIWLGELEGVISLMGYAAGTSSIELNSAIRFLIKSRGGNEYAASIKQIAYRCLAVARLKSPVLAQSAFIPTGADFDAIVVLSKIFGSAKSAILIVDPYLDASVLSDFAILAKEGINIALLADATGYRPDLEPATRSWIKQYGARRPLCVKLAPNRTLHDRVLLIDQTEAWILTQSLKDFADRSPATVQRVDQELAAMKFQAYADVWNASQMIGQPALTA
jgi:hypothetical protein